MKKDLYTYDIFQDLLKKTWVVTMGQPEELLVTAKQQLHEKTYNFETPEDDNSRPTVSPRIGYWRQLSIRKVSVCKWLIGTCIAFMTFFFVCFIIVVITYAPVHNGTKSRGRAQE